MAKTSLPSASIRKKITKSLVRQVMRAVKHSYAPYSNIHVSAGVYCPGNTLYTGVNVENSSFGLSMCAERVAMYKALSAGERTFQCMLVYSPQIEYITPCGACLQVIAEFAPDMIIVTMNNNKRFKFLPLTTLLTYPFHYPAHPQARRK